MDDDTLSVNRVATLCGVDHSTVGYWIRKKKLYADRSGGNYKITLNDLMIYLKSSGRKIPLDLLDKNTSAPCFGTIRNCWDYWEDSAHGSQCIDCVVYRNSLENCITASMASNLKCNVECDECAYYQQTFLQRIGFIHQFNHPAAVYKGVNVWGVNEQFADLCGREEKEFIGMGIEYLFHPDSLEAAISIIKRQNLNDPNVPDTYHAHLRNREQGKIGVRISVYPLKEPSGAFLMMDRSEYEGDCGN